MMQMKQMNRKTATKLLLVQWVEVSALMCKSGRFHALYRGKRKRKSTILDAMIYLLTGNRQFNKAAKDRDRTVLAYMCAAIPKATALPALRSGEVISYIAMEFWSPVENQFMVVGVCIESANETAQKKQLVYLPRYKDRGDSIYQNGRKTPENHTEK